MTAADSTSVLQRMVKVAAPVAAEVPLTASRAVKLAMTRSAEASIGLVLTVDQITEETQGFDQFIGTLTDDMVLLWIDKQGEHAGVLALDKELSTAIVEMRTTGRVREAPAPDRRATAADISLAQPLFTGLLAELDQTTAQTVLEGWTAGARINGRIASVRATSLALPENTFRHMSVDVDLGAGGRKGKLRLALPTAGMAPRPALQPVETTNWAEEMEETVMESPAILDAILHRSKFPLSLLADLKVGQVIPLVGCSVSSVKLEAPDGTFVGRGRIGQMGGNIAVRLETPEASPMIDLESSNVAALGMDVGADMMSRSPELTIDAGPVAFEGGTDAPIDDMSDAFEAPPLGDDFPAMGDFPDMPMGDLPDLPMGEDAGLADLGDFLPPEDP